LVSTRLTSADEAVRRTRGALEAVIADGRRSRLTSGLTQRQVAAAMRCSRQLIGAIEGRQLEDVGVLQLARYSAIVGLDLTVRAFPNAPLLHDIGQLRLLDRFKRMVGDGWTWRTEVSVSTDSRDRRAIDALLARGGGCIGVEAVTRFLDAQGQARAILQKQEAMGLGCMLLVLADTRLNRAAADAASATLDPAFPLGSRAVLGDLRAGRQPAANGLVFA
jgi:transcriptional regulator with XRE-family HTH domain